jgi:hypothetical protein
MLIPSRESNRIQVFKAISLHPQHFFQTSRAETMNSLAYAASPNPLAIKDQLLAGSPRRLKIGSIHLKNLIAIGAFQIIK